MTVSRPGDGNTLGSGGLFALFGEFRAEFVNDALALQVPDLDARSGGSAEPVSVGREAESVDDVTGIE